jgi:hypothetical protein
MNSSLDTDWVGIGEGKADVSAGNNRFSSSELRNPIKSSFEGEMVSSFVLFVLLPLINNLEHGDLLAPRTPSSLF